MNNRIKLACGQITWRSEDHSSEEILRQIAQAGYEGAPFTAPDLATAPQTLEQFETAGLKPAPAYLGASLWVKDQADAIVKRARELAQISQLCGLTELYVAPSLTPERRLVSGHVGPDNALSQADYSTLATTLNRVGETTLKYGVRTAFHNHVGSYIETRTEIDELFTRVDPDLVFHGPDLGHLAWAGDDVLNYLHDYLDDIVTIHIKDIDPVVRTEGVANKWDYGQFSDHGIFTELGKGMVEIPAVIDILQSSGFGGWIVVETDVTQRESALESATMSRDYLRNLGI